MSREILFTYNNNFENKFIDSQEGAADPFLIKVNGYYFLFFTYSKGLMCYRTFDLLHFEKVNGDGHVEGEFENIEAGFAPEVFYFNGYYYLICSPCGNGHYIFKSKNITGPFVKITSNIHEMIDGSFFVDSDEKIYLSRASETGIILKEFNDNKLNTTDFELFKDEICVKEAKIGRWNEGPYIIKRYGKYYLTYTGTHFLSSCYRVEYVSGESLNNLKYKDVILLSSNKEYYGLGHSMNVLAPNLDSYYICYHNMNDDGVRRFNIARLLFNNDEIIVNNKDLTMNFNIERPVFETFVTKENEIFETKLSDKFSIEFNLLGKNSKGIFGYVNESNYYSIELENNEIVLKHVNDILLSIKLKREYDENVMHNIRIQYKNKKLVIYFDSIEFLIDQEIEISGENIGYLNNKLDKAYIACSNYAFGDSDYVEPVVNKTFIYKDIKDYIFFVKEDATYLLSVLGNNKEFSYDLNFSNKNYKYNNEIEILRNDLDTIYLEKGFYNLKLNKSSNIKYILLNKINKKVIDLNLEKKFENISNFDVYHRYDLINYGLLFENDRNAILTKDKLINYEVETTLKLLGNPVEDCDFVGLVVDINHYGKDNSFENCYSMNGYIFSINSNYIYIILARFNHSKILYKLENNFNKKEFKLIIKKQDKALMFYLDDKLIYKTIDNDIYIDGKVGIYNNHASGIFKYLKIKGE